MYRRKGRVLLVPESLLPRDASRAVVGFRAHFVAVGRKTTAASVRMFGELSAHLARHCAFSFALFSTSVAV